MLEIKGYKTKDGRLFEDFNLAREHQEKLDFKEFYKGNEIADDDSAPYPEEILQWLKENKKYIIKLLTREE